MSAPEKITFPSFHTNAFNCPVCKAFAYQTWHRVNIFDDQEDTFEAVSNISLSFCASCNRYSVWYNQELVYPEQNQLLEPNEDLPEKVKQIYDEARSIAQKSPRSANALLRLALEELIDSVIGKNKKSLDDNILDLVRDKRLPNEIRDSMEILRVVGNGSLHPGVIDIKDGDTINTTAKLFELINAVASVLVSQPKIINRLLEDLPEKQKKHIKEKYSDS